MIGAAVCVAAVQGLSTSLGPAACRVASEAASCSPSLASAATGSLSGWGAQVHGQHPRHHYGHVQRGQRMMIRTHAMRYLEVVGAKTRRKRRRRGGSDDEDDWLDGGDGPGGSSGGSGHWRGGGSWNGGHGDFGGYSGGEFFINTMLFEWTWVWQLLSAASLVNALRFLLLGGSRAQKSMPEPGPGEQAVFA